MLVTIYRVHIGVEEKQGGVAALSAVAYITTLYVMVDIVKGGERVPPHPFLPSTAWADLPIWWNVRQKEWNVRQKEAIATLCVLCGGDYSLDKLYTLDRRTHGIKMEQTWIQTVALS